MRNFQKALLLGTALFIPIDAAANPSCRAPAYRMDPYQAFGDLPVFGHQAERSGEEVPKEWRRPHGFFRATYRGETVCEGAGKVTVQVKINLASGSYSNHPHIAIYGENGTALLERWLWPEYECNTFSYDMERALRTYDGPLQLGLLRVRVVDLARRLVVRLEGCRPSLMLRQPWPY